MIILGIDPGLAIIGYGLVEYKNNKFRTIDYGAITTPAGMSTREFDTCNRRFTIQWL